MAEFIVTKACLDAIRSDPHESVKMARLGHSRGVMFLVEESKKTLGDKFKEEDIKQEILRLLKT